MLVDPGMGLNQSITEKRTLIPFFRLFPKSASLLTETARLLLHPLTIDFSCLFLTARQLFYGSLQNIIHPFQMKYPIR